MLYKPGLIIRNLNDPELESEVHRYLVQASGSPIQTLTLFPITVRNRLVGMMEVVHLAQPHLYSANALQLAQAIVSQVTVAIENAQLFQQTQKSLEDMQKLYNRLAQNFESSSVEGPPQGVYKEWVSALLNMPVEDFETWVPPNMISIVTGGLRCKNS